jgi:hypothetical protein
MRLGVKSAKIHAAEIQIGEHPRPVDSIREHPRLVD